MHLPYLPCRVWYIQRDDTRQAAIVVSVDITHPPPSYSVLLAGADSARETEGHRLRPMPPEDEEALRQEAEELEARAADSAGNTLVILQMRICSSNYLVLLLLDGKSGLRL